MSLKRTGLSLMKMTHAEMFAIFDVLRNKEERTAWWAPFLFSWGKRLPIRNFYKKRCWEFWIVWIQVNAGGAWAQSASLFFSCFPGNEKFYSSSKIKSGRDKRRQERGDRNTSIQQNKYKDSTLIFPEWILLFDNWPNFWQLYNTKEMKGGWSRFCQNFLKESFLWVSWLAFLDIKEEAHI